MSTIIMLIIFFIFLVPFTLRINIRINLLQNKGELRFVIFNFIPIFSQIFVIKEGCIELIKNPKKIMKYKISFKKEDMLVFNYASKAIIGSQLIAGLSLNTNIGIKNCVIFTSMLNNAMAIVLSQFISINISRSNILKSDISINPNYSQTRCQVDGKIECKNSIFEWLSAVLAIISYKRKVQNGR